VRYLTLGQFTSSAPDLQGAYLYMDGAAVKAIPYCGAEGCGRPAEWQADLNGTQLSYCAEHLSGAVKAADTYGVLVTDVKRISAHAFDLLEEVKEYTSVILALKPDPDVAETLIEQYEGEGRVDPGGLHVTLCYLGAADDLAERKAGILDAAEAIAATLSPLDVRVSGFTRFTNPPDGGDHAVVVALDSADLDDMRADLANTFERLGLPPDRTHGFTPHITLAYVPPEQETRLTEPWAEPDSLTFEKLWVFWGDEQIGFPLGSDDTKEARWVTIDDCPVFIGGPRQGMGGATEARGRSVGYRGMVHIPQENLAQLNIPPSGIVDATADTGAGEPTNVETIMYHPQSHLMLIGGQEYHATLHDRMRLVVDDLPAYDNFLKLYVRNQAGTQGQVEFVLDLLRQRDAPQDNEEGRARAYDQAFDVAEALLDVGYPSSSRIEFRYTPSTMFSANWIQTTLEKLLTGQKEGRFVTLEDDRVIFIGGPGQGAGVTAEVPQRLFREGGPLQRLKWDPNDWETTKPWEASAAEIAAGKYEGIRYNPDAWYLARNNFDGTISVGPSWDKRFPGDTEEDHIKGKRLLMYHEAGHTVSNVIFNSFPDWVKVLQPFSDDSDAPISVRSTFGFGQNHEEWLSDRYADLMTFGDGSYESPEYITLYAMVRHFAEQIGFPVPPKGEVLSW
jgi:2'-5' RNA ligase